MTEPLVSVIVPTFNRRAVIADTVDSVLAQDWPRVELVCVDDGSTDGTPAYLRERCGDKLVVVEQSNQGPSAARNAGLAVASGNYLCVLDSDDLMCPGSIRHRVTALAGRTDAIAYGMHVNEDVCPTEPPPTDPATWPEGPSLDRYLKNCFVHHSDLLFHRSLLPAHGRLYDPQALPLEDFLVIARLLAKAPLVPSFAWSTALRKVCGTGRSRYSFERMLKQGTEPLDRLLDDPEVRDALKLHADALRWHFYSNLANAAWKTGDRRRAAAFTRAAWRTRGYRRIQPKDVVRVFAGYLPW